MSTSSKSHWEIAVIGGGPAGMSCALWLKQLGLSPTIIERNAKLGGQLLNINRINRWVLGLPNRSSAELAGLYEKHIYQENIPVQCNTELVGIDMVAVESAAAEYRLILQEANPGQTFMQVQAMVIATGVRVPGREIFGKIPEYDALSADGLIASFPTGHLDKPELWQGKTVAVIGGGDNAHFTVRDVAATAARTYLIMRSHPKAGSRIRKEVEILIEQGRVIEFPETQLVSFRKARNGIEINLNTSGSVTVNINVDMIYTRTGFTPNSEFLDNLVPLADIKKQSGGYLSTDSLQRTSIASVYAIGDVCSPGLQSVVTAIADGAKAAKSIALDLSR